MSSVSTEQMSRNAGPATGPRPTYVSIASDESIHHKFAVAVEALRKEFGKHHPMHIGDKEVFTEGDEIELRSPVDRRIVMGMFPKATKEQVQQAIAVANEAFPSWSCASYEERVRIFRRAADILEQRVFHIAALTSYEVGKSRLEALAEVYEVVDWFRYYCDQLEATEGFLTRMRSPVKSEKCVSVLKPYGTWAVISPFNFPVALANNMCAGALMMANTVVFKPASAAAYSGLKLYEIYREAGIPAGVVNYMTGPGQVFGDVVTASPGIAGVAFVGSMEVGCSLQKQFTERQPYTKPFISEMGSKNPVIVTDEADVEKAAMGVMKGAFGYQGQKCSATSRVYVQKGVAKAFTDMLVAKTKELRVGNPVSKDVFMGPVVDAKAVNTFIEWVEKTKADGARILCGGNVLSNGDLAHGFYVEPTVIAGLTPDHPIFREELFLPVLALAEYERFDDALRMANDTEYGLTAGVFSEDKAEIEHFFRKIQFGVCYANRAGGATTGAWPGAQAFVGWKASGTTGKGVLGPHYLQGFAREQAQTVVE